jgi:flavin-dependent dehydrogenase
VSTDIAVIGAGTAGGLAFRKMTRVGCMSSKAVLRATHDWVTARA